MRWRGGSTGWADRRDGRGRLTLLLVVLLLPFWGAAPAAATAPAVRVAARAHFGGNFQADTWAPITVQLANDGPGVTGEVVVEHNGSGPQGRLRYVQQVELPTRSQKAVTLYALLPGYATAVNVGFDTGRERVDAAPVALRQLKQGQRLIGVLGDDERAGGELARAILGAYGSSGVEAVAGRPDELPDNGYGLGSLATIVLHNASTGRWSAEQRQALADWVARGGRLIVTGGPDWRKTVEGLGELAPLRFSDSRAVAGLGPLSPAEGGEGGPGGDFVVAVGQLVPGATPLADRDGLALVARRGWGRGTVTALAFDPAGGAFLGWAGAGAFWKGLGLDAPLPTSLQDPFVSSSGPTPYPRQGGYRIANVLRDLPTLALPPVWVFGLVILALILAVGPLNYLLLRRLDRRELAWVTIPLLTLLFTGGIYGYGAGTKGRTTVVNTVSIVRIVPGGRLAEAQSFYGVFTPSRGIRQLPVGRDALLTGFSFGQRGPGGFGDPDLGGAVRFAQGDSAAVRDASFAQWSLRAVAAQATVDPAPLSLQLNLRPEGSKVVGEIVNSSGQPVEDVTLLLDGYYTRLGSLAPGASQQVDWTPSTRYGASGMSYGPGPPGLGAALYYNGPGAHPPYYGPGRGNLGLTGWRAEVLDTLSGSVLSGGGQHPMRQAYSPYGPPTPTPTPTPTPMPATAGPPPPPGARAGSGPLQVLFWRADTPLELRIASEGGEPTTLIIQETFLGPDAESRRWPETLAALTAGGGR